MSTLRYGALDLGSNTFHLLIMDIDTDNQKWSYVDNKFYYMRLAEFSETIIPSVVLNKAFRALDGLKTYIDNYKPLMIFTVGTAALRNAKNGHKLIQYAANLGIKVNIISGIQEAEFILSGLKKSLPKSMTTYLAIDIGGGSVEFTALKENLNIHTASFPIGVGLLYKKFHNSDPLSIKEQDEIKNYLDYNIRQLINICNDEHITTLIGSSGTFEVLSDLCYGNNHRKIQYITTDKLKEALKYGINSTLLQRKHDKRIPSHRKVFVPVGFSIIQYLLSETEINEVYYSSYAIKEGIIAQLHAGLLGGQTFAEAEK